MKRQLAILIGMCSLINAQNVEEDYWTDSVCDPEIPDTCDQIASGGCCMTYTLTRADGELDGDWEGMGLGDSMNACAYKAEVDFLS